jgi:hypothetical protein
MQTPRWHSFAKSARWSARWSTAGNTSATRPKGRKRQSSATPAQMRSLFGDDLLPIFVPPWNRFDDGLLPVLAQAGYVGVSTYLPRVSRMAAPDLVQINTHIDPIYWRGTRGLVPPETLIATITKLLQDRRSGRTDPHEPLGFLTHHLVHDEDIWGFTHACLSRLLDGGAVPADMRSLP